MKVLITASVFSHIDQFHRPYLKEFHRMGWEVHIACGGEERYIPFVDQLMTVPFRKRMGSVYNLKAAVILRGLMVREKYDLIITHTSLASFFTRLAAKGLQDRPPLCVVVHGYLFDDETLALRRRVLETAEKLMKPETDLLLTMNQWDYENAVNNRLAKRIKKIPGMGVDFKKIDRVTDSREVLRDRLDLPRDAFVLVYAAEFSRRKSQSVLIEAMTTLPKNVYLVLAGDGTFLDSCKTQVKRLGLGGRVRFPGRVSDMETLYHAADACVSASRFEGLPFNIMEAMHCGLPVVASRVKGHIDLIEDDVNGLLYPYGDAEACAGRICELLKDRMHSQALKERARKSVGKYGLAEVLPVVMACFESTQGLTFRDGRSVS